MPVNRHAVELGVVVGLANTVIFLHFLPPVTDVKAAEPFNADIETSERTALMVTTAFTLLVAGFARSVETFMIGGAVVLAVDFAYKHANAVVPGTSKMAPANAGAMDAGQSHPLPDYAGVPSGDAG
jgi:hypothetical protein